MLVYYYNKIRINYKESFVKHALFAKVEAIDFPVLRHRHAVRANAETRVVIAQSLQLFVTLRVFILTSK